MATRLHSYNPTLLFLVEGLGLNYALGLHQDHRCTFHFTDSLQCCQILQQFKDWEQQLDNFHLPQTRWEAQIMTEEVINPPIDPRIIENGYRNIINVANEAALAKRPVRPMDFHRV